MRIVIVTYLIACYGAGIAGLVLSLVMSTLRPNPIERAHFRFLASFSLLVIPYSVLMLLPDDAPWFVPIQYLLTMGYTSGCALIAMTLPRFMNAMLHPRYEKAADLVFLAIPAFAWAIALMNYFSPYSAAGMYFLFGTTLSAILYAILIGNREKHRDRQDLDSVPRRPDRWERLMRWINFMAIGFTPLFILVDFYPELFPVVRILVPEGFRAFPLFYAAWNVFFIRMAVRELALPWQGSGCDGLVDAISASSLDELALSPREREVATLLLDGLSYKEISGRLTISLATVKTHVSRLYQKTGSRTKMDLSKCVRKD